MTTQAAVQPVDRDIARDYVRYLVDASLSDDPAARREFCARTGVHPKLLQFNPHLRSIASLFGESSNVERLLDMTLRDYLYYHYYYIHQAYRYGLSDLQQRWMGHDLIKTPWDCWIYQEIIWETKPDVVIELGVMFGGASHFFASLLDLLGHGEVLGIDVTLDKVARVENPRISYLQGSSVAPDTIEEVRRRVAGKRCLVIADSDHEKNHVLQELRLYAEFVPVGGYLVAEDSLNDVMRHHPVPNEGPQAAARAFLAEDERFVADRRFAERYVLTLNPDGYLKRVRP
jgi:cephalosporin hydroxylase